jgi:PAS domain S-box-containing protein
MKDPSRSDQKRIDEISGLKQRIQELEQLESKRKLAEEALQLSRERLEEAQRIAKIGNWEADLFTGKLYWSQVIFDIFGFDSKSFRPSVEAFYKAVHPDDRDMVLESEKRSEKTGLHDVVHRIIRSNGEVRIVHELARRYTDEKGKLIMLRGTVQDITERKRVENAWRESEEKFRTIFDKASDGILIADAITKKFLQGNATICSMLGYTKEEIESLTIYDIHPPKDISHVIDEFEKHTAKGETALVEDLPVMRKDGSIFYADIGSSPAMIGGVHCLLGIFRDTTERKRAEEALQKSAERYRALVENASDIVFRIDDTGHITFVNPAALRIMGYEEKEIIGRHYPTFIRSDMQEEAMKFFGRQFVKGIPNTYSEYPVIVKDGHEIWLGQNTQLIFQDGKVVAFQAVARDITERKRAEEELRRNQHVSEQLAQEIAIIAEIGKVVGSTLDIEEVYENFAAEVRKLIPFDRLAVNLHNLHEENVRVAYVFGEAISGRSKGALFPLKGSISEILTKTRAGLFSHPKNVEEMDTHFPNHVATFQAGMRSLMGVPLIYRNEVIGSLHFRSKTPNTYTDRDLRLAERIGAQIAGAIGSAKLFSDRKTNGGLNRWPRCMI